MSTLTTHYNWVMPTLGGDPTTWGSELNNDLGLIDAQVWANQQAGVPIGSITMFAGATAPTNWLICDGSSLSTTTYATLFAVIGYAFGGAALNFNLPNLRGVFPVGASSAIPLAAAGGEAQHTLNMAEMPVHAHTVNDPGHNHTLYDPGHVHGLNDPGHAHGYNLTRFVSVGVGTLNVSGGTNLQIGNTDTNLSNISVQSSTTNASANTNGTGVSLSTTGSGGAHNNMPPYVGVNFIIRFQ